MCGTTEEQFAELMVVLAPSVEQRKRRLADRPDRKRAPGAGQKPAPWWLRLLVALTHLRQGTSVRATAAIFGIHERSVRRYRDEVEEVLVGFGFRPPGAAKPIRSLEDLAVYVADLEKPTVILDGTDVRRWSPYPWKDQQAAWSAKTGDHVVKATVVADSTRRPIWVEANPSGEGRTNDIAMLRAQQALLTTLGVMVAAGATVLVDRGYQTLWRDLGRQRTVIPAIKNRHHDLSDVDRRRNRQLSSIRMPVEHACGRMKWWRALSYWRRPIDAFDRTIKAIGALAAIT
jgi:hypothetical protein